MEISFDSREIVVYKEFSYQTRRVQESAESVVPDTDADIEKLAAVQSGIFLKSKDLTARGVLISGELAASVLYIRDGQAGVSGIRVRKPFTIEYDVENPESEALTQVSLFVQGTDVRVINPRKISVTFDVEGQLNCYRSESLCVDASLPENTEGLHVRMEDRALTLPNAVCEKSIAINEQFGFPAGQPVPTRLVAENAKLLISDCQLLGSKMIVKGSAEIFVCGIGEDDALPTISTFSTPFSQIIDVGAESMQFCQVRPEITGAYFDLIDTINGEKALDMELHAVLQIVCSENRAIRCITDAYSNLMPTQLQCQTQEFALTAATQIEKLNAEGSVGLMEECRELLQVFASVTRISAEDGKISAALTLDFLFRNGEEKLSACRRTVALTDDKAVSPLRVIRIGQASWSITPDGENVNYEVSAELCCAETQKESVTSVSGVMLDEETAYVQGSLPTLTLVRREGESLWALAKRYHSSEEKIRELNEDAENAVRMLLIPKCI